MTEPTSSQSASGMQGGKQKPKQLILVGSKQVELPGGVTVAEWGIERVRVQNPRVRTYLGCIRLLEENLESNYALLHCSPRRLLTTWRKVREVLHMLKTELAPLLEEPSRIPLLEEARVNAFSAYKVLASSALEKLESLPDQLAEQHYQQARRTLGVSMGQIHSFLRDTFGEIVAADPRSLHDSDYYLSRRFQQEIDEAEWLYATVESLRAYIEDHWPLWQDVISQQCDRLEQEATLPPSAGWSEFRAFLETVQADLTPRLRHILALDGVRFEEMQTVDLYAVDLPVLCQLLSQTYELSRKIIETIKLGAQPGSDGRLASVQALTACHEEGASSILSNLYRLRNTLRDIVLFLPVWLSHLEQRRALMLTKDPEEIKQESRRTRQWRRGDATSDS